MKVKVTQDNIRIENSFEVGKGYFGAVLAVLKRDYPDCRVWNRGCWSLKSEWAVHNFCHRMHIARSNTGDVDLNWPQRRWEKLLYPLAGALVWHLIK